ncbi:unnamed protein product [Pleuronectes platessa]|uniref:Uncharacterized protein n=1 Tax=Pleuronectes platessa TaxID=8262 RepID=A0A9N7VUW2_PLEPL|nr:unnamed protein product [Pleuronectes platessa]
MELRTSPAESELPVMRLHNRRLSPALRALEPGGISGMRRLLFQQLGSFPGRWWAVVMRLGQGGGEEEEEEEEVMRKKKKKKRCLHER